MNLPQLRRGDQVIIKLSGGINGIVDRTWTDEETGTEYIAIRTEARDERVIKTTDILTQVIVSRDNEVPDRVGRGMPTKKKE